MMSTKDGIDKRTVTERGQSNAPKALRRFIELINAEWPFYRPLPSLQTIFQAEYSEESVAPLDLSDQQLDFQPIAMRDSKKRNRKNLGSVTDKEFTIDDMRKALEVSMESGSCVKEDDTKAHYDLLAQFSLKTRRFLGPPSNSKFFVERYRTLNSARALLLWLSKHSGEARKNNSVHGVFRPRKLPTLEICSAVSVNLTINDHNELEVSPNPVLEALRGVSVDRIRGCIICGKIFWASRINSECCNLRCRKNYNQRNRREALLSRKKHRVKRAGRPEM